MTYLITLIRYDGSTDDFTVSASDIEDAENYVRTNIPDDWSSFTVECANTQPFIRCTHL
jgi:hypothetical protein